jgi:hypothetical protein
MKAPSGKALGEGNCAEATQGGEEACDVTERERLVGSTTQGARRMKHLTKSARLRTERSYKAGSIRRVSTTSLSRSQTVDQVKDELVQRKLTFLSEETCQGAREPSFAPASKHHRLKGWNAPKQFGSGEAGVSRGRSTELRTPIGTGRTKQ